MKKALLVLLSIVVTIGACGCMDFGKKKYEEDILAYLEAKYDEKFEIDKLSRVSAIGTDDVIYAACSSERFPNDSFEVALTLSLYDIYGKEELISVLKQADVYGGELDRGDSGNALIADNYINVIVQNAFDAELGDIDGLFVKTQITTANNYLNVPDKNITPDKFFEEYGREIVVYTSIFVSDQSKIDDSEFLSKNTKAIVHNKLYDQFIFYYATDLTSEEIESLYAENYDNNNEFFYDSPSTVKYAVEKYTLGEKE